MDNELGNPICCVNISVGGDKITLWEYGEPEKADANLHKRYMAWKTRVATSVNTNATPPKSDNFDNVSCASCNGPMWDNRTNKKTSKSPDFKCKDKLCGRAAWIKGGKLSWSEQ